MPIRFAINGLGRVGRALLRVCETHPELELVAVNDLAPAEQLARLIARDSIYGPFGGSVSASREGLRLNGRDVAAFCSEEPARIPWGRVGATIVVEATGASKQRSFLEGHLRGTVKHVLAAWNPAHRREVDVTLCAGINDSAFDRARHRLISAASCTTNCLAPVALVLHQGFGLRRGMTNSVHGVTNNQVVLDAAHREPRRARSALMNIVPTASNAAPALGNVVPELDGHLESFAVRVPAPHGALLDLVVETEQPAPVERVREAFRNAAGGPLSKILTVAEDEPVSTDIIGNPSSAVVDLPLLQVVEDSLVRVVAWYDNEWGYANRMAELLLLLGSDDGTPSTSL